jgi:hypothetical protein
MNCLTRSSEDTSSVSGKVRRRPNRAIGTHSWTDCDEHRRICEVSRLPGGYEQFPQFLVLGYRHTVQLLDQNLSEVYLSWHVKCFSQLGYGPSVRH